MAYRWFIGYDIDEKIPDHSVLSKTRRRKFIKSNLFEEIFDEIIKQCIEKGFIKGETILTDSTHVKANASFKSIIDVENNPREYFKILDASLKDNKNILKEVNKDEDNNKNSSSKVKSKNIEVNRSREQTS